MLCYKDKTFCTKSDVCGNKTCWRNFTDKEREGSQLWWKGLKGFPPVLFSDFSKVCGAYQPTTSSLDE